MHCSIYRVQSSTRRLPIRALFGFTLKLVGSYPPLPLRVLCGGLSLVFTLGRLNCFDDSGVDKKKYLEAMKRNPLGLGRDIVHTICASSLRCDKFDKIVVTGNLQQWFKSPAGEVVQLPEAQLLRDVKTRWDSIFYMLNHLLALHLAIECFLSLPAQKDLANFKMINMEWFILLEYAKILEVNVHSSHSLS